MDDAQLHVFAEQLAATGITDQEVRALIAESRNAAPAATTTIPVAPATATPPAATDDPSLARAEQAVADAARRQTLVDGARAILTDRHGRSPGEEWSENDLLIEAGLAPRPESPAEKHRREMLEADAEIARDPAKLAQHRREAELTQFRTLYWQLSKGQRAERMAELGIDPSTFTEPTGVGRPF